MWSFLVYKNLFSSHWAPQILEPPKFSHLEPPKSPPKKTRKLPTQTMSKVLLQHLGLTKIVFLSNKKRLRKWLVVPLYLKKSCSWCIKTILTSWKINMEAKDHPMKKENHLNQTFIGGFHVSFPGCSHKESSFIWDQKKVTRIHPSNINVYPTIKISVVDSILFFVEFHIPNVQAT